MAAPPRDEAGRVIPHDDRELIADDSFVLRSIPFEHLKSVAAGGGRYLSKAAFSASSKQRDPYEGMSVNAGSLMSAAGVPEEQSRRPGHAGLVKIRAGDLRRLGLQIGTDPLDQNPYHAQVWGVRPSHRNKIKNLAIWVDKPDDVVE
jgi:hypothetical protein